MHFKGKKMKENTIYIIDDEGKQVEMKIYLTFDYDDKQYVVVYEDNNIDELYPFVYDDGGNLYPVENEDELQIIEEVVSAYEQEEEK